MLKLIKYEMIHTYRSFGLVYALFIIGCFAVPFLPLEIGLLATTFGILIVSIIAIAVSVTIAINYNTSMFKKPGYLTLTLPVSTHKIVLGKVISALLWLFISMLITGAGLAIAACILSVKIGVGLDFLEIIAEFIKMLNINAWEMIAQFSLLGILNSVAGVLGMFALITILQTKYTRNCKGLVGIVIFIVYAYLISYIAALLMTQVQTTAIWPTMLGLILQSALFYTVIIVVIDKKLEIN